MSLKKLSITAEQAEQVKQLLEQGFSHYKISAQLNIHRLKIWKNVQIMGVEKKRKNQHNDTEPIFRWSDYDNSVI